MKVNRLCRHCGIIIQPKSMGGWEATSEPRNYCPGQARGHQPKNSKIAQAERDEIRSRLESTTSKENNHAQSAQQPVLQQDPEKDSPTTTDLPLPTQAPSIPPQRGASQNSYDLRSE